VDILDEYIHENGQVRLLIIHGDQFDTITSEYPLITNVAAWFFHYIQKWAPHSAARWIRRTSKRWQRNSQVVQRRAVEYAMSKGCAYVTCGHTHLPLASVVDGVHYFNSGTWTDHPPCPFVAVRGGDVSLEYWPSPRVNVEEGAGIAQAAPESLR
jgi:UDP-2,3-diacylglucosamine pyrophosphatase LpxH